MLSRVHNQLTNTSISLLVIILIYYSFNVWKISYNQIFWKGKHQPKKKISNKIIRIHLLLLWNSYCGKKAHGWKIKVFFMSAHCKILKQIISLSTNIHIVQCNNSCRKIILSTQCRWIKDLGFHLSQSKEWLQMETGSMKNHRFR